MAQLWAARALRLQPTDGYVLRLMYGLGPRTTARAPTDALACRVAADSSPATGAHSLRRENRGWRCVVDRADEVWRPDAVPPKARRLKLSAPL